MGAQPQVQIYAAWISWHMEEGQKAAYLVMTSHPIYIQLRQKYWSVKKRKRVDKDNDINNDSEDE